MAIATFGRALMAAAVAAAGLLAPLASQGQTTTEASKNSVVMQPAGNGSSEVAINPGKMVSYNNEMQQISAYYVSPQGNGPWPAVIVAHGVFGITPFVKQMADNLARKGFVVLIPNLYSRDTNTAEGTTDPKQAAEWYNDMTDEQAESDLLQAIPYLGQDPAVGAQPIGLVGYDMGGIYALIVGSKSLKVKAIVDFYGQLEYANLSQSRPMSAFEAATNLKAPLLAFYGALDPQTPPDALKSFKDRLRFNPNNSYYEVIVYPTAGHGFLDPHRQGYDAKLAQQALAKAEDFLTRSLHTQAASPPPAAE